MAEPSVWSCEHCGAENGPLRSVFCKQCGGRRTGWGVSSGQMSGRWT